MFVQMAGVCQRKRIGGIFSLLLVGLILQAICLSQSLVGSVITMAWISLPLTCFLLVIMSNPIFLYLLEKGLVLFSGALLILMISLRMQNLCFIMLAI